MPDFTLFDHGSVLVLNAESDAAKEWADAHLSGPETQGWGPNGTVIEPRYYADIENGILADGLTVIVH